MFGSDIVVRCLRFLIGGAALLALPAPVPAQPTSSLTWVTLGTTGGPIPNPTRSQPANAAVIGRDIFLFDTGDGAAGQLASAGFRLDDVRGVFLSHLHLDHSAGLQGIIGLRWMNAMPGPFRIYGPVGTRALVDGILASMAPAREAGFGLRNNFGSHPVEVDVVEIGAGSPVEIQPGITVAAVENSHYSFEPGSAQASHSKSLSFRLEGRGCSIVYTGDTGPSAAVTVLARNADLLVSEVQDLAQVEQAIRRQSPNMQAPMFASLMEHLRLHHLSPEQVGEMASAAHVGNVVLTHMVPGPPGAQADGIFAPRVRSKYDGPVTVAVDLQRFSLGRRAGSSRCRLE